ncbi:MAG: alpha/beta fold hydrolase [Candidatus Omnitrophica bacterium]|nr:alpha/beta fold hydrolase [Candidatus Omnitrophota bacterium]
MRRTMKKHLLCWVSAAVFSAGIWGGIGPGFAEVIRLKRGEVIRAPIIEQTDEYIKVKRYGTILTYWKDDIEEIGSSEFPAAKAVKGLSRETIEVGDDEVRIDVYNPGTSLCPVVILIHGSAGIQGDRAQRYKRFATDLMNEGVIAINVHYFQSARSNWGNTFVRVVDYAQMIPNADKEKIGIVGYSLGGTIGLEVASADPRVKLFAMVAGFLPPGFRKEDARRLPRTLMVCGDQDSAYETLLKLEKWFNEMNKPYVKKVEPGIGHDNIPMKIFKEDWDRVVVFFTDNFGITNWGGKRLKVRVE